MHNELSPLMSTYNRFPITIVKGKGSYVWDDQGQKYLDFTAGIATCNLGHVPDVVTDFVKQQLDTLWHCSNLYNIPNQEKLARLLVDNSFADQVFFCNSGAEANEGAIKLARRYSQKVKGTNKYEIVTFKQSFHGRTLATLTATGQEKIQNGFAPLVEGFRHLPYNDLNSLDQLVGEKTCAVLLELVQGEGGVLPANEEWIKKLYQICKEHDILFMVDEVQTGVGRTGKLFAYEHYGIEPDVITLAKGLGSGMPIGAVLAKKHVSIAFEPGTHGTTFGGNPLVTASGLATVQYIVENNMVSRAAKLAEYFHTKLVELKNEFPIIEEIRGKGLLIGLGIQNAVNVVNAARAKNMLVLVAGPNTLRILPPLTATNEEVDLCISILRDVLKSM